VDHIYNKTLRYQYIYPYIRVHTNIVDHIYMYNTTLLGFLLPHQMVLTPYQHLLNRILIKVCILGYILFDTGYILIDTCI